MKKFLSIFLGVILIVSFIACDKKQEEPVDSWYYEKTEMKTDGQLYNEGEIQFPSSLWETPEYERYDQLDNGASKGYFIKSVQGTWVFCFVGIPDTATPENPAPGIVLVHGGGGTAFYEWVNTWVSRGYAAIAMDTCGKMPAPTSKMSNVDNALSIKSPVGPNNPGYFADIDSDIMQQWAYHATASIIASNSFLRSFENVNEKKIAITGISYGSFLTCQATAYDDRFACSVPVYHSFAQEGTDAYWGTNVMIGRTAELWDDVNVMKNNTTPVLYLNSNIDNGASVEATTTSVKNSINGIMLIKNGMLHSHEIGAFSSLELFAFVDSICLDKTGLIKFKTQPEGLDPEVEIIIPKGVEARSVFAFYAKTDVLNKNTDWDFVAGEVSGNKCFVSLPSDAVSYYIQVMDDRGYEVSSHVVYVN